MSAVRLTLVALAVAIAAGHARAEVTTHFNDPNFAALLAAQGWAVVHEGFEQADDWGLVRSTIVYGSYSAPDVPSQGLTWNGSGGGLHGVTTGGGAAGSGDWGFYSSPHGDILQGIPDGFVVTSDQPMYAFGGRFRGTYGADIILILDGDEANPIDLGDICEIDDQGEEFNCVDRNLGNSPFVGVIDPDGFTRIEIRETEAGGDEAKYIWFDDAQIAFATTPSPRTPGVPWNNPAGGTWSVGSNWLGGAAPGPTDNAILNLGNNFYPVNLLASQTARQLVITDDAVSVALGGNVLDLTQDNVTRASLIVGEQPGDTAGLTITEGQITAVNAVAARAASTTGEIIVSGTGALATSNGLRIGAGGNGNLNIYPGGQVAALHAYVGQFAGVGNLLAIGPNAAFNATGVTVIGTSGPGTLAAVSGAAVTAGTLSVAAAGDGLVTLDDPGTLLAANTLSVGTGNQVGSFYSTNTEYFYGDLLIRNGAAATSGTSYIGDTRRGVGVLTVTGPGSDWTTLSGNTFVGYYGDGTLNVLDGATVNTGQTFVGRFGIRDVLRGTANVNGSGSTWNTTWLYVGFNNNTTCSSGLFASEGILDVSAGGHVSALQLSIAERWSSVGTVTVRDAGSEIAVQSARLGNTGTWCGSRAHLQVSDQGALASAGQINAFRGEVALAGGSISGTEVLLHGPLQLDPNHPIDPNETGILSGHGTVTANVDNLGGWIIPSATSGLDIDGDLRQDPNHPDRTPTWQVNVDAAGHGHVLVTGTARLGGRLQIVRINDYQPPAASVYEILTAGNVIGDFDKVLGREIDAERSFAVEVQPTRVLLRVLGDPQPGDANGDGTVDLSDLALVLQAFGACTGQPAYLASADFDDSGCVDLSDLGILLANFGA